MIEEGAQQVCQTEERAGTRATACLKARGVRATDLTAGLTKAVR